MASERKKAEGQEHLRQAEKCLKTGFLKWKADLDGAASEYGKAAVAFKNAKAHEEAANSYLKCSEIQRQMGSAFHAAKSMESAALIFKETKNFEKAADLVEQAANLFLEHGTPDTAAVVLDRVAKMIEYECPERAVHLYSKACEISEGEDRPRQCAEMLGKAGRILLRLRRLDEAAEVLKSEMDFYEQVENNGAINKLVLGLVLVQLHRKDYVAADMAFRAALSYTGFASSEEAAPIERLLEAYDQCDQEAADAVTQSPLFKYMENEFTKLARDLRVPGGGGKRKPPRPVNAPGADADGASGNHGDGGAEAAADDEEDDYASALL